MIIDYNQLSDIRSKHKGQTIGYTGGVFDLLHVGHVALINYVATEADVVVIGIMPDVRVRAKKGSERPVVDQATRLQMVDAVKGVDYCFVLPERVLDTYKYFGQMVIGQLRPDIFITSDAAWRNSEDWMKQCGIKLSIVARFNDEISTTQIIDKIKKPA